MNFILDLGTARRLKVNLWLCLGRKMERKEDEEDSKRTAPTEEDDLNEDTEEAGSPIKEGAFDGGDGDDDEEEEDASSANNDDDDDDDDDNDGNDNDDKDEINEVAAGKKEPLQRAGQNRKCVPGIIYLGHIPPRLRPKHVRNMLSVHGEIGRIFLQPEGKHHSFQTISLHMVMMWLVTCI